MQHRLSRRAALSGGITLLALTSARPVLATASPARFRVIVDNDLSGDPDGLFQLAHQLLSPSVVVPLIVGSHLPVGDGLDASDHQAGNAAVKAGEVVEIIAPEIRPRIVAGAETGLAKDGPRRPNAATAAIIAEALRTDTHLPLFYAAGAGLTDLALALMAEPGIGRRMILIWIGGAEYPADAKAPPGVEGVEYNTGIDPVAAQIVFNDTDIEIWQIPRNVYRQLLFSRAELDELRRSGRLGDYLVDQIDRVTGGPRPRFGNLGETYILGDSPLVTLTALQSSFNADPSSSPYRRAPTPFLNDDGSYRTNPQGRPMRVYTAIDLRLTFADMIAKFHRRNRR